MRTVDSKLSLKERPEGRVLEGKFDFGQDARFLLFAWNGQNLAWAKAPRYGSDVALRICYHPCLEDRVQLMAHISGGWSGDLMLTASQMPKAGVSCHAEMSVPSVLYTTTDHGVGLLAIPHELTKSRRKGLWHIKPAALNQDLTLFEQAYGRCGMFSGHPFVARQANHH